jgi:hypothetical protein
MPCTASCTATATAGCTQAPPMRLETTMEGGPLPALRPCLVAASRNFGEPAQVAADVDFGRPADAVPRAL